jgi:hypothetical protein
MAGKLSNDYVYVPVETRVSVFFEKDHICCQYCPFFETYSRKQCRLTGEYIVHEFGRGYYCRLELEGNNETVSDTETG